MGRLPDPVPDPHRLLGAVVEDVERRLDQQVAVAVRAVELQPLRTADHPLGRDAVDGAGDGPHEVAAAAGDDVAW